MKCDFSSLFQAICLKGPFLL